MDQQGKQNQPITRRDLLVLATWTGLATAVTAKLGEKILDKGLENTIVIAEEFLTGRELKVNESLRHLFDNKLHAVAYGNYNQIAARVENKTMQPSPYIRRAASSLIQAIRSTFNDHQVIIESETKKVSFDETAGGNTVFLGGPLSNPDLARFLGYSLKSKDRKNSRISLPKPNKKFKLRFEHFHGETTLGEFDGKIEFAKRYSSGKEVSRPQFALKDHSSGKIIRCDVVNGWLASDFLQIVKTVDSNQASKLCIWGLHGHALDAFFDEKSLEVNLSKLCEFTENIQQFQIIVPVNLQIENGYDSKFMKGEVDWTQVSRDLIHPIG